MSGTFSLIDEPGGFSRYDEANHVAVRMRQLLRINPYMSDRPDVLDSMAKMDLSAQQLVDTGGALYGMGAADSIRQQLEGMTDGMQRSVFAGLSPAQQMSLHQMGYRAPERDEGSLIGDLLKPVGTVIHAGMTGVTQAAGFLHLDNVLDFMAWAGDQPAHLYRAIRMMDPNAQLLAIGGALIGAASVVAAPFTGGASLVAGMGTLQALGSIGGAALIGGTAAAAATNPSDWLNAWKDTANGERAFDRASQAKAADILGDPRFISLAKDLAYGLPADYSAIQLAKDITGHREVSLQAQVSYLADIAKRFADPNSDAYQRVYDGLVQMIQLPQFQQAVQTLQNGKISFGRDIADGLGLDPSSGWHRMISGAVDMTFTLAIDPFLLAGKGAKYLAYSRRGMEVADGAASVDRFYEIYNSSKGVRDLHEAVAKAINAYDYDTLRRVAPSMRDKLFDIADYRAAYLEDGEEFTVKHLHDWLVGQQHLKPLMEGFGTVRGLNNGVILSQLGPREKIWQAVAGPMRSLTWGLTDPKTEAKLIEHLRTAAGEENLLHILPEHVFPVVADEAAASRFRFLRQRVAGIDGSFRELPEWMQQRMVQEAETSGRTIGSMLSDKYDDYVTELRGMVDNLGVRDVDEVTPELLQRLALSGERHQWARLAGRTLGHIPGAHGVGALISKMTTMVPAGDAIYLVGDKAPESIRNFTELAALTGMPQWMRREFSNMILWQPTPGMRMTMMQSFLDTMLHASGMSALPEGQALIDKYLTRVFHSYAGGGLDTLSVGGRLSRHSMFLDEMADAVSMPDLTELRKAVKGGIIAKAIGIADIPVLEQFQAKVWKPSVLMRIGFIPRAAGEEFLNYMVRGGFGSLGQELGARSIARVHQYEEIGRLRALGFELSATDKKLWDQGPMPAGMRWLSRMLGRHDWASPLDNVLNRYATFYRGMLEEGLGQEQRASALLSKVAGTDMQLNRLALNAEQRIRNAEAIDKIGGVAKLRLNLGSTVDSLLFGNEFSWRRMIAGGVHDDLIDAADQWYRHHGTAIMREVSATEAGPYDPGERPDLVRVRVEDDAKGEAQYATFHVIRGQRTLRGNDDQFFTNALHHQMTRPIEDELGRTVIAPNVVWLRPATVSQEQATRVLTGYWNGVQNPTARLLTHEFLGTPDFQHFQAVLASLQRTDPRLAEHLAATIPAHDFTYDRVLAAVRSLAMGEAGELNLRYDDIVRQLTAFKPVADELATLGPNERRYLESLVRQSSRTKANAAADALANPTRPRRPPSRVVYRGVSSPNQFAIVPGPNGPVLRVYGAYQPHFDGLSVSTSTNYEQAINYLLGTAHDPTEGRVLLHMDLDALERQFGGVRPGNPEWTANDNYPGQLGVSPSLGLRGTDSPRGIYPIGLSGEYNIVLNEWDNTVNLTSKNLQTLADDEAAKLQAYREYVRDGQVTDVDHYMQLIGDSELRLSQYRELLSIGDLQMRAERASLLFGADTPSVLGRAGRGSEVAYVDLQPGEWRIQSLYSEGMTEDLLAREEERLRALTDVDPQVVFGSADGMATWQRRYDETEANIARLKERLAQGDLGTPNYGARTPQHQYVLDMGDELAQLSEDDLINLLIGGGPVHFPGTSGLGKHYGDPAGGTARSTETISPLVDDSQPLEAWSDQGGRVLDAHDQAQPYQTLLWEIGNRRGIDREAAAALVRDRLVQHVVTNAEAELAGTRAGTHYLTQYRRYTGADFTAVVGDPVELMTRRVTPQNIIDRIDAHGIEQHWNYGEGYEGAKALPPWVAERQIADMAKQGATWGTMPAESPWFDNADQMYEHMVRELTNQLQSPYMAGKFGHSQAAVPGTGYAAKGERTPLHQARVGVWVPRTSMFKPEALTFEGIVANAKDPNYLLGHRQEVEAFVSAVRATPGGVVGVADRRLADEITRAAGWADETTMVYQAPRAVISSRPGMGVNQVLRDAHTNETKVWSFADSNMVTLEHPEAAMADTARQHAERMVGFLKQYWVAGSTRYAVPRTRPLADGEGVETLVKRINHKGDLVQIPAGEKLAQREEVYDLAGKKVDFGDGRFFDSEVDPGNGEIMWAAVGPMLADAADEAHGAALLAAKPYVPRVGEMAPRGEMIRVYRSRPGHLLDANGLPNLTDSIVLRTTKESRWDRFTRFGFDRVLGPGIDAMARRPMAFHFFAQRYMQNKALREWLRDPQLVKAMDDIVFRLSQTEDPGDIRQVANYARQLGKYTLGDSSNVSRWTDTHALGWLRGHDEQQFGELVSQARTRLNFERAEGMIDEQNYKLVNHALTKVAQRGHAQVTSIVLPELTDTDLLAFVRSRLPQGSLDRDADIADLMKATKHDAVLAKLTEKDWKVILASEANYRHIVKESGEAAVVAAINDMMPFIDDHELKTQFAEYGRGFLPFWYAEENFMKRWARTINIEGPAAIRKLQLTYMGLKTAGVVRSDTNGRDWFVYPGSNLLAETLAKIPGVPDTVGQAVMFASPTDSMLPGMNSRFGVPQVGPLVSVPLDLLTAQFPELQPFQRDIVGDIGASRGILDQIVPTPLMRTFAAFTANDGDRRFASAKVAAIAHLEASGQGLPDDATPGQIDEFLRTVTNHARVILLSQALGGWFAPGPLSPQGMGSTANPLAIGELNPGEILNDTYQELVKNLGIEEGTVRFLELYPKIDVGEMVKQPLAYTVSKNESVSGAPLPATELALSFFDNNSGYMAEFPNAGPWLLPQDANATGAFSQYAYDQQTINGLRRRRTPEEFLTQIKFKEASTLYFATRTQYLDEIERARTSKDQALVRTLNDAWNEWSLTYKSQHPIFAQQLESGESRQSRQAVISEMRTVTSDPSAPETPHLPVLRQMMRDFDWYLTQKAMLSIDASAAGKLKVEQLKATYESHMNDIVLANPAVQAFWTGILRPESALE